MLLTLKLQYTFELVFNTIFNRNDGEERYDISNLHRASTLKGGGRNKYCTVVVRNASILNHPLKLYSRGPLKVRMIVRNPKKPREDEEKILKRCNDE